MWLDGDDDEKKKEEQKQENGDEERMVETGDYDIENGRRIGEGGTKDGQDL